MLFSVKLFIDRFFKLIYPQADVVVLKFPEGACEGNTGLKCIFPQIHVIKLKTDAKDDDDRYQNNLINLMCGLYLLREAKLEVFPARTQRRLLNRPNSASPVLPGCIAAAARVLCSRSLKKGGSWQGPEQHSHVVSRNPHRPDASQQRAKKKDSRKTSQVVCWNASPPAV